MTDEVIQNENIEIQESQSAEVSKKKKTGLFLISIIFGVLAMMVVSIYQFRLEDGWVKYFTRVLPIPAAVIHGRFVTYHSYLEEVGRIKSMIDVSGDSANFNYTENQIRERAFDHLVQRAMIRYLARKEGVKVSDDEVNNFARAEFAEEYIELYGDDIVTFLLTQKLSKIYDPKTIEQVLLENSIKGVYKFLSF